MPDTTIIEPKKQLSAWRKAWDSLDTLYKAVEADDHGRLKDHAVQMFGQVSDPKSLVEIGKKKFTSSVDTLFRNGSTLLERVSIMTYYATLNHSKNNEFFDDCAVDKLHSEKNVYLGMLYDFVDAQAHYQESPSDVFVDRLNNAYNAEPVLVGVPFAKLKLNISAHIAETVSAYGDMAIHCAEQAKLSLGYDTLHTSFQRAITFDPERKADRLEQARGFKAVFDRSYAVAYALSHLSVEGPRVRADLN